jgi:hypothetical protein
MPPPNQLVFEEGSQLPSAGEIVSSMNGAVKIENPYAKKLKLYPLSYTIYKN